MLEKPNGRASNQSIAQRNCHKTIYCVSLRFQQENEQITQLQLSIRISNADGGDQANVAYIDLCSFCLCVCVLSYAFVYVCVFECVWASLLKLGYS